MKLRIFCAPNHSRPILGTLARPASSSNCVRSQNKASILEGIVLFSSADTKITLERLFCEFFSVKNQIKKVLYSMSPKTTIFCSKCEARRSSDWLRLPKNDTWHFEFPERWPTSTFRFFTRPRCVLRTSSLHVWILLMIL